MPTPSPIHVAALHLAAMPREACIIAAGKFGPSYCLLKNRDRNYVPQVKVVHEVREGVEVAYLKDEKTGWIEGLNGNGVGIVNSALMVSRDETERDEVERTGKKLLDGTRILNALVEKTVDAAVKSIRNHKDGLKGHTLVSDGKKTVYVEMPDKDDEEHGDISLDEVFVRTNHGVEFPDAGYVEGPREESSKNRQEDAKKVLKKVKSPDDVAPAILLDREDRWEPTEMVRDNRSEKRMRTTSQMVLDLTDKKLILYLLPGRVEYLGLDDRLPKGHEPEITVEVREYDDLATDTDGGSKVVKKQKKASEDGLLPILDPAFNLREIFKQLVLLEDHLFHERKRCPDCIWKHLLTAEALAEEAVTLDTARRHPEAGGLAEDIRGLQRFLRGGASFEDVAQQARIIRKGLLGVATSVKVGSTCSRAITSLAWVAPDGEVHDAKGSHPLWAHTYVWDHPALRSKVEAFGIDETNFSDGLLQLGWIRVSNQFNLEVWEMNTPGRAAWKAAAALTAECVAEGYVQDPEKESVYVFARKMDHWFSPADFVTKFGGRQMADEMMGRLMNRQGSTTDVQTSAEFPPFVVGDIITHGKFLNKPGRIERLFTDEHGNAMIEVSPVGHARRKNRIMSLYRIRHADPAKRVASAWLRASRSPCTLNTVSLAWIDPQGEYHLLQNNQRHDEFAFSRLRVGDPILKKMDAALGRAGGDKFREESAKLDAEDEADERLIDEGWVRVHDARWVDIGKRPSPAALEAFVRTTAHCILAAGGDLFDTTVRLRSPLRVERMSFADIVHLYAQDMEDEVFKTAYGPKFGPSQDLADGVKFRVKSGFEGVLVRVYENTKLSGYLLAHWSSKAKECQADEEVLRTRYPALAKAEVLHVWKAFLDEGLQNRGVGRAMYQVAMSEGFKYQGDPILFTNTECILGSGTSSMAKRVWASLARQYPSSGDVVAVLRTPKINSRDIESEVQKVARLITLSADEVRGLDSMTGFDYADAKTRTEGKIVADVVRRVDLRTNTVEVNRREERIVREWIQFGKDGPTHDASVRVVVGKYKEKKKVKTQDGDEATVYVYSERQIQHRNREKAKQVEKLHGSIDDLRKQVAKDIDADDAKLRLTALAVGLIDHTFERVGNESSADEGHFGVTGWLKQHVTFGKGKATISYVGKSGVDHKKVVDDAKLVKALKSCCEGKGKDDPLLSFGKDDSDGVVRVTSRDVNAYLEPFDVTAKDLRGYHANRTMAEQLRAVRKKGPNLPADKKEKEKVLKAEFKEALEATASAVGHEAATLRSQYLSPGVEDDYLRDGSVSNTLKDARVELPLREWVEANSRDFDPDQKDEIWEVYTGTYRAIGLSLRNITELLAESPTIWCINVDDDASVDAFIAYKRTPAGNKLTYMGSDGTSIAKRAMLMKGGMLLMQNGWYTEASLQVATIIEKSGLRPIDNEAVVRAVLHKDIEWLGDGRYRRTITGLGPEVKSMYGSPHVLTSAGGHLDKKVGSGQLWYHLTDRAKFKLDSKFMPADNAVAIEDRSGQAGIYLGADVERWVNGFGYWRPFVVEIQVDPSVMDDPGIGGRWGGELFVPATSFDKLDVKRVIPLDAWAREQFNDYGWVESAVGRTFDTGEPIVEPGWNQPRGRPFPGGYHYTGPDVRNMPASDVNRLKQDLRKTKGRLAATARVASAWMQKMATVRYVPLYLPRTHPRGLPVPAPKKPTAVWLWTAGTPNADSRPKMFLNALIQHEGHDWKWVAGKLKLSGSVTDGGLGDWYILQYGSEDEATHPCPSCMAAVPDHARFCPFCGAKQPQPRVATKTPGEREDEEAERLSRPSPKKKPPRDDSKRERVDVDRDPDLSTYDKDLSLNHKDVGG